MRLKFIYLLFVLATVPILASCNAADTAAVSNKQNAQNKATPETIYPDGAPRITTSELAALIKEGKAYVVDVRNQESYDVGHIPGSRLIPATDILKHVDALPRDKTIVTYCS